LSDRDQALNAWQNKMPFAHELQLLAAKELREGFCQELNGLLRASAPFGNSVQIIPMRKSHPECLDLLEEHEGELSSSEFARPLVSPGNFANSLSLDRRDQVPQRSPLARREFSLLERAVVGASRMPGTRRYLRQLYADPLTGRREWGLIRDALGSIQGVYSLADGRPIRRQGFGVIPGKFRRGRELPAVDFRPTTGSEPGAAIKPADGPLTASPKQNAHMKVGVCCGLRGRVSGNSVKCCPVSKAFPSCCPPRLTTPVRSCKKSRNCCPLLLCSWKVRRFLANRHSNFAYSIFSRALLTMK
jgi:hypothetical protein